MRFFAALILLPTLLLSQSVKSWREQNERALLTEFAELVRIPNVSSDLPNIRRNATAIRDLFLKRGVKTELLTLNDYAPIVLGELTTPGATRWINFYAHYDGMPVTPSEWTSGQPFLPELRTAPIDKGGTPLPLEQSSYNPEWRLFGRAASDDKAPIFALAASLDAIKALGLKHRSNIRFFFEGEEEAGSPHLTEYLEKYKSRLTAALWLICDGPVHQNRQQSVVFGVRGSTSVEITAYGPKRELHSGHYGGWAPNPAQRLVRLLSTFTDGEGHILVKDFYKGVVPFTPQEMKAIEAIPAVEAGLQDELGLAELEGDGARLFTTYSRPTLNIRGLKSVEVGKLARNVIPSEATAALDIRLVKGLDSKLQVARLKAHIQSQGWLVLDRAPTDEERRKHAKICKFTSRDGYNAVRTPLDLPIAQEVIKAVESASGKVVIIPTHGGSVPLAMFEDVTKTPLIMVPIVNHDNNQHSFNENLRLANLWSGIEVMTALLTQL